MNMGQHFEEIQKAVDKEYELAERARAQGLDPVSKVEVPVATTLAEKAVGLISVVYPQITDKKIVDRILELEKQYGQLDIAVSFSIAEEIAREKFCKFKDFFEAIDAGIRVGFAYNTLGVVSSPIEGYTGIKVKKTKNGEDYLAAYFSGPIRSAGTTAGCVVLMLIDYLREIFGFAKYDPTEEEVKRYVTENYDYHERVTNLQYLPTEEEITFLAKNIPIEISGEPSEDREVLNYKDLPRVETNFIRGGMCLIFSEGLAQKAQKGLRLWRGFQQKGFKATGWEFLDEYISLHKKREKGLGETTATYIKDIVAGRPVLGHPSKSGGFRFRYGRSRTGGFSATAVHPATMAISNSFLSSGTQLKIERPTKGCAITVCDEIDGPIVKLIGGDVRKLKDFEEAHRLYSKVDEIIYLGDLLFPLGDVINRNYELLKPGYVEEWWALQLEKASQKKKAELGVDDRSIDFSKAKELSEKYKIPLHPDFIYYWTQIDYNLFLSLLDYLSRGTIAEGKLVLPYTQNDKERFSKGKRALELLGCEHIVSLENVVLNKKDTLALLFNLGIECKDGKIEDKIDFAVLKLKENNETNAFDGVRKLCEFEIKDKAGTFIGARMGRPEKAKLRKLTGSPHALFPVGEEGGRLRSFQAALEKGEVRAEFSSYYCNTCDREEIYPRCEKCAKTCQKINYCSLCDKNCIGKCDKHEAVSEFKYRAIQVREYFDAAKKRVRVNSDEIPIVKGIRGTSNKDHTCEHLSKGILRAKYNLHVNKDGTIRYDMTEMAITHFKPKEIGTSVQKLKQLGYSEDIFGKDLERDDQILALFPHDIILPACPETQDEKADDVFFKVSKFLDDELEKFYGLERFYKAEKKEDIIGAMLVCIAPHICTASVARLIGFSKIQALLASPFMHAAMRRDCDGDEAAVMLLMDLLLNFSRKFLPAHRGGTQDAPLVLNTRIRAGEVDDQILDLVTVKYPLEIYELAEAGKHSSDVKIENIKQRLKTGKDAFTDIQFTHNCSDFNSGVLNSSYKKLPTMSEKVSAQMDLCKKLRAVDTSDVAR